MHSTISEFARLTMERGWARPNQLSRYTQRSRTGNAKSSTRRCTAPSALRAWCVFACFLRGQNRRLWNIRSLSCPQAGVLATNGYLVRALPSCGDPSAVCRAALLTADCSFVPFPTPVPSARPSVLLLAPGPWPSNRALNRAPPLPSAPSLDLAALRPRSRSTRALGPATAPSPAVPPCPLPTAQTQPHALAPTPHSGSTAQ